MLNRLMFAILLLSAHCTRSQEVYVLGTAQDGGYPHMGCKKKCCEKAWKHRKKRRFVTSIAITDTATKQWMLFEATPDIKDQLEYFKTLTGGAYNYLPESICLTHAHMGHYTGLMEFGKEVMDTKDLPVYVMPRMMEYLQQNGPWSQLVTRHNIILYPLKADERTKPHIPMGITPILVPHRDEYSETAGYKIDIYDKKLLFIPDIDKWGKWKQNIVEKVKEVDIALIDATFYDNTELPGRNMAEVPHPFVAETMELFAKEPAAVRNKIYFIHLNHTNPLLFDEAVQKKVKKSGFNVAKQGAKL